LKITYASCGMEKEPLKTAFGFKGNALTCLWQIAVSLKSENNSAVGLGVQSVLWSDAGVFKKYGEEKGNELMYSVTKYALSCVREKEFETPFEIVDLIFDEVYQYALKITENENLSKTFVLNALVAIDFALWQLWMKENNKNNFDDISEFDGEKQNKLANIPLITYSTSLEDVVRLAEANTPLLKIKIGSDPNKNGSVRDMLEWDKNRLREIHEAVKNIKTTHTETGNVLYYLDANGRYDSIDTLKELLDFAREEEILERIILLEEPFPEEKHIYVGDLPVTVAADESVHGIEELKERFELGYKALTLKPIAKGITMSVRMAELAREKNMVCFCADLTVNPLMVSFNQCVAARLKPLAGMKVGVVESNGAQNYAGWERLKEYHPMCGAGFITENNGVYELDDEFYENKGGILKRAEYYCKLSEQEEVRALNG